MGERESSRKLGKTLAKVNFSSSSELFDFKFAGRTASVYCTWRALEILVEAARERTRTRNSCTLTRQFLPLQRLANGVFLGSDLYTRTTESACGRDRVNRSESIVAGTPPSQNCAPNLSS